jgi:phage shock protein PspC (stress-responsive transcriptional regulator)
MAKVFLRADSGRGVVDLPPICIKCGAPATVRKNKQFSWQPPWVPILIIGGVWPYIIVSLIMTKRKSVETPLCDEHKSYWWMYPLMMWMLALGLLALGAVALVGATAAGGNGNNNADFVGLACGGTGVALLALIIVAAIMNSRRIRPTEITDRHVHLTGVSPEFADAVDAEEDRQRSAFDRGDDYGRGPRRSRQDDDPRYTN